MIIVGDFVEFIQVTGYPELVRAFDASPLVRDLMDSPKNRVVLKGRR